MRSSLIALALLAWLPLAALAEFELAAPGRAARIFVPEGEPECVRLAARDLAGDAGRITGQTPSMARSLEQCAAPCVVLASTSVPSSAALLERLAPQVLSGLRGKWEAFQVSDLSGRLLVAGSDERGTMFGIYAFIERYLGVDPLYIWSGRQPARHERLAWNTVRLEGAEPTFRYRGWFVNDEDLLTEWKEGGGKRHIEYPYYHQVTAPDVLARVYEAMLRHQHNLVIPASFTDIANPDEERMVKEAVRRGLFVSMHHVEPLGVSGFAFQNYWRLRGRGVPFSFARRRAEFEEVWSFYAARWARYPGVVWQLGLRGIADRPVWVSDPSVPAEDSARGKLISDAMARQWEIVRSVDKRPDPPATTTLWMEGSDLNLKGLLRFPPGLTVVFADNSPGWKLQEDFYKTPREPGRGYGIYYHHALWGSGPHFVQGPSPQKTHQIFKLAVERGDTQYAILNVSNVREFVLGLDGSARMLRDFASFDPDRFLTEWCRHRFATAAPAAERAYRRLFASYVEDEERGQPVLLDGQTLHAGERIFGNLLSRALAPSSPRRDNTRDLEKLLKRVRRQRKGLADAGTEADRALPSLTGEGRALFEVNFVAQHQILSGLLHWLEAGVHAAIAEARGDATALRHQVRSARDGLGEVRRGMALASRGEWKDWYRGDRKMNIDRAEAITRRLLEHCDAGPGPGKSPPNFSEASTR